MKTKDELKKYFKNKESKLKVLDGGKVYGRYAKKHYNAVSLTYLHKYVLKERVTKRFVARKMFELCQEKFLLPIPCTHAGDLVFCRYDWSQGKWFDKWTIDGKGVVDQSSWGYNKNYPQWIANFNKYL